MEVVDTKTAEDSSSDGGQQASSTGKEKKQGYTETPSAKLWPSIPEDWEMVAGNAVYDANPTRYAADEEVDYIEMDALKTDLSDPKYVGRRDPSDYSGQMFAEGDTLFAQITPCTENGKAALVPELESSVGIGSTEFIVLSPDETKILPRYLYYLSKSHPVHNYAVSRMRGSTGRQRVPVDVFRQELQAPLPPLSEQRKIASVLYAVDQAIQKTEAIIEQAQRVRKGLEQKLLTRGILENGGHRRDSELEYKSSWVGKVPTEWRICEYGDLLEESSVGIVVKPSQYYDSAGTVPILRSKDISRDGIVDGEFEYMTKSSNEKNSNSELNEGDVITVRSGDPGLSCVVPSEYDGSNCADLLISTPGPELSPEYAAMWINSYAGRRQIDRFQAGLAQKHFNLGALRKLRIAVPPIEEQERIIQVEKQITDFIGVGRKNRDRLKRLKRGLMQDLLTGDVRTADKAIEVLDEVAAHG
jgi:type I restriction enzyme S subunit